MEKDIKNIREEIKKALAECVSWPALEKIRTEYLGRQGRLTAIFQSLKDLALKEKKRLGPAANALRGELAELLAAAEKRIGNKSTAAFDPTKPIQEIETGHPHPLALVEEEIVRIFTGLNFSVVEGPEIETDYYNFDALNIPADHPARDTWDTFWLKQSKNSKLLLRTHTSPMQIRFMEKYQPPFQIIVPGRVFRYEATDTSHEINFYQIEGLMVAKKISLANFKFVIEEFLRLFFESQKISFRYRPSYFPFVEPGVEVDIKLGGKWLEILGAGLVHPNVFKAVGYPANKWQGFAFGAGLERLAMIKYGIPDIRLFYSGDLRLTKQFN